MTEEEKKIKKWSNEEKVEALAKFIALRSGDPRKALLYGFMLDCLLEEINKKQRKIEKQQSELEKKDEIIDLMAEEISNNITNTCPLADYNFELDCENRCNDDYKSCWRQYFERKVK